MGFLRRDIRFAIRILTKKKVFTSIALVVIALGIGANTAMFSLVKGVLLHSLPYEDTERLVFLWGDNTLNGGANRLTVAPGVFLDWRRANSVFTDLAASRNSSRRLTAVENPVVRLTHMVTTNYFDLLGVQPYRGRAFLPGDRDESVVILSFGLFFRFFPTGPFSFGPAVFS